jgi:hypothetical protein
MAHTTDHTLSTEQHPEGAPRHHGTIHPLSGKPFTGNQSHGQPAAIRIRDISNRFKDLVLPPSKGTHPDYEHKLGMRRSCFDPHRRSSCQEVLWAGIQQHLLTSSSCEHRVNDGGVPRLQILTGRQHWPSVEMLRLLGQEGAVPYELLLAVPRMPLNFYPGVRNSV